MSVNETKSLADVNDDELISIVLEGLSPASRQSYRYDLDHFAKHRYAASAAAAIRALASTSYREGKKQVADFLFACEKEGDSGNTLNRRLNAIKSSIQRLRDQSLTDQIIDIKRGRVEPASDMKGPSLRIWQQMLAQAQREAQSARKSYTGRRFVRDYSIALLVGERGLKRGAIASLDYPGDVNLATSKVRVSGQWLEISAAARDALAYWVEVRGHWSGPLFTRQDKAHARNEPKRIEPRTVTEAIKALAKRTGVKGRVIPGQLRNAAKSRGLAEGWTIKELQAFTCNRSLDNDLVQTKGRKNFGAEKPIHRRRSNSPKGCPVKLRAQASPFLCLENFPIINTN